jgi:hypothetical protein
VLAATAAAPARAQVYENALRALDYLPDPIARSPRLLGMGRLKLADDVHNRITLWDFAGNPTGVATAESLSVFEYRPTYRSSKNLKFDAGLEREDLAAGHTRHDIETWHRSPGTTAYGLVGEIATLKVDRPYGENVERRGSFVVPNVTGIVNGRVPWIKSNRFDYALRLGYGREFVDDGYYEFFRLPQGEYLGRNTAIVPPPDLFTPDESQTKEIIAGVALSARVTPAIVAAIGYDYAAVKQRSTLEGLRSTSKVDEDRPYNLGQASVIARIGPNIELGADGRAWSTDSEQFYFWSISAGPTTEPLSGSGKRLDRQERGTTLRTRGRWVSGRFELGAGFGTAFRRTIITPWFPQGPGSPAAFNDFLDQVGHRVGADTLMLPERVSFSQVEERAVNGLVGGTWKLPGDRGLVGVEYERGQIHVDQPGVGGSNPTVWEVRVGGEVRCGESFLARAGFDYGIHDRDDLTADNASRGTIATAGIGYRPVGGRWSADLSFANEWVRADYVDPAEPRGTNRQMSLQLRWPF